MATPNTGPGTSTARSHRAVCDKCKRTVFVVFINGERVQLDPEVISVVPYRTNDARIPARRVHAELCMQYQLAEELKRAKAKLKAKR